MFFWPRKKAPVTWPLPASLYPLRRNGPQLEIPGIEKLRDMPFLEKSNFDIFFTLTHNPTSNRESACCLPEIRKFWTNSAHLRTRPRYWCDNAVQKISGLWGNYFWSYRVNGRTAGRTYWPILECTFWVHKKSFLRLLWTLEVLITSF